MAKSGLDKAWLQRRLEEFGNKLLEVSAMPARMRAWPMLIGESWKVRWREGKRNRCKSCGPGPDGEELANELAKKIHAELTLGIAPMSSDLQWESFVAEYDQRILSGKSKSNRVQALAALANFARITKPGNVATISTRQLDEFTSKRRKEKSRSHKHKAKVIEPASVNADLRQIKHALKIAKEWGYLKDSPRVRMEREPKNLPTFVTSEDFDAIYAACASARLPDVRGIDPVAWWRGLITFLYCTGWRIGETLELRREDVDLNASTARIAAEHTKGRREEITDLNPAVVKHLDAMPGVWQRQFHWPHNRRTLHDHLKELQELAGVKADYSWHDFRRAFGTINAAKVPPKTLQFMMRHQSHQTTARYYLNPMQGLKEAVGMIHVPKAARG